MTEQQRESDLLLAVVNAVYGAHDLESALRGTARALQEQFPIWHASLWLHLPERQVVRVIGSWSISETAFDAGVEVSTAITPNLGQLLVDMHAGKVFSATLDTHGASLLDHLMREEGVAGLVAVPLGRDDNGLVFLALGCATAEVFADPTSQPLFRSLAASAGARYVKLAATPKS
jgi:GAF domain-containing protein